MSVSVQLNDHQWGMILSADQNGHFMAIPCERADVEFLVEHGLFRWQRPERPNPISAELTPLARSLLSARPDFRPSH